MRIWGLIGVVLGLCAVSGADAAVDRSPSIPIVYGYPYASRCPAAGYADAVDRWGMYMCNCTSYVAWALRANGQRTDWFIPGAMDARNWPHVAQLAGLPIGTRPRARSVVVWPHASRPFGHIAYVTKVESNGGVDVGEYNWPSAASFDPYAFDLRYDVSSAGAFFIYVPPRVRASPR